MSNTKIRLAIIGVGNCAAALVQGLEFYRNASPDERVPGIMHVQLGGYHIGDMEVVAAFDVDGKKVGKDVSEAIFTEPNNTIRFADVPPLGVTVQRGPTLDGLGKYYREEIVESADPPVDVAAALREAGVDVVVNYLPVGSEAATRHYAQAAIEAGAGFVNCMPVFIASTPEWARRFAEAGLPIVGDDIKSQVGATIVHRVLAKLFEDRGVKLERTYQLNFGGNMDFMNMLERERLHVEEDLQDAVGAEPAPRRSWAASTSTSARPTTCRGSRTASGRRSGWRAGPSATCRSTWSSSSRSGTRRTRPAS